MKKKIKKRYSKIKIAIEFFLAVTLTLATIVSLYRADANESKIIELERKGLEISQKELELNTLSFEPDFKVYHGFIDTLDCHDEIFKEQFAIQLENYGYKVNLVNTRLSAFLEIYQLKDSLKRVYVNQNSCISGFMNKGIGILKQHRFIPCFDKYRKLVELVTDSIVDIVETKEFVFINVKPIYIFEILYSDYISNDLKHIYYKIEESSSPTIITENEVKLFYSSKLGAASMSIDSVSVQFLINEILED